MYGLQNIEAISLAKILEVVYKKSPSKIKPQSWAALSGLRTNILMNNLKSKNTNKTIEEDETTAD